MSFVKYLFYLRISINIFIKVTKANHDQLAKGDGEMGNQTDGRQIRSRSEKRAIEKGRDVEQQKEFFRGNGSQNNRIPNKD
jgi:hypothetical protein